MGDAKRARGPLLPGRDRVVGLWLIRLANGLRTLQSKAKARREALEVIWGHFGQELDEDTSEVEVLAWLGDRQLRLENASARTETQIQKNITWLAKVAGLNAVEAQILTLGVFMNEEWAVNEAIDRLQLRDRRAMHRALACILNFSDEAVALALRPDGRLRQSGLVTMERAHEFTGEQLVVLPELRNALNEEHLAPQALMKDLLSEASAPELDESDFLHLEECLTLAMRYLEQALLQPTRGVNLLLYGLPGTGKSQMARVIAKALRARLFEVRNGEASGESMKKLQRLSWYRMSQHLLRGTKSLIVFDEIEDIFGLESHDAPPWAEHSSYGKAWMNRLLEANPVPAIWIDERRKALLQHINAVKNRPPLVPVDSLIP